MSAENKLTLFISKWITCDNTKTKTISTEVLALCLVEYEWYCPLWVTGISKDHHYRHLLPTIWLDKRTIILKVSCSGKKKMLFSSMTIQDQTLQNKSKKKKKIIKMWDSSTPSILTRYSFYRFSFVWITKPFHKWLKIQKQKKLKTF